MATAYLNRLSCANRVFVGALLGVYLRRNIVAPNFLQKALADGFTFRAVKPSFIVDAIKN